MKLRRIEKMLLNTSVRTALLRRYEAPRLFRDAPDLSGKRCLEIGCGYGHGLTLIRGYTGCSQVIGIDIDPDVLGSASRKGTGAVLAADVTRLPFRDASFAGVFQFFVYEHVREWWAGIAEVFRVLEPGGVYMFEEAFVPDSPLLLNPYFGHVPIEEEAFREKLARVGFTIRRFEAGIRSRHRYVTSVKPELPSEETERHV